MNGALVVHLDHGARYHRHHFTATEAAGVLAAFREAGLEPCVYVDRDDVEVFLGSSPSTHPDHASSFGAGGATADLDEIVAREPVFMFGILGQSAPALETLAPTLSRFGETHVSPDFYDGHGVTVAPRGLSKWIGVGAYCREAGLDPGRVLAIGDGPNDLELLGAAAVAVVPDEAHPEARALADHVVASPRAGGWAELLDLV
jgi:hydroxymethylpyrimidine pyrophosphatase-like HAD family hydrolase